MIRAASYKDFAPTALTKIAFALGAFFFADGHAQFVREEELNSIVQRESPASNCFISGDWLA